MYLNFSSWMYQEKHLQLCPDFYGAETFDRDETPRSPGLSEE